MDPIKIIDKYYSTSKQLKEVLVIHSEAVAKKALQIVHRHPELELDESFVYEASMLHDIGIFMTKAPSIFCEGDYPYIAHGYLGADLMRKEGYNKHAWVCERHTGTGLSLEAIEEQKLPLPHRDMQPISLEEQVICFADKFYSKSNLTKEKTVAEARKSLLRFGKEGVDKFDNWCKLFL